MPKHSLSLIALGALAACGGGADEGDAPAEPAPLELTPGSWSANAERASFAGEDGAVVATMRCDAETGELLLETPGGFAEGARPAMALRIGDTLRGIEGVELAEGDAGPVKRARFPVRGSVARAMQGAPVAMTIETDGGAPVMMETGEALSGFVSDCEERSAAVLPGDADLILDE